MRNKFILLCTIAVVGSGVHARDIYRCVSPSGEVTLTNIKCPADTTVHLIGTYEPVPDSPNQRLDAAIQAADISAQQAREAALRAQSAANQATQVIYESAPDEPQGYHQYPDDNVYFPAFVPGYPLDGQFDARFPGHRQHQRAYVHGPHPEQHDHGAHPPRHANSGNPHPQLPGTQYARAQNPAAVPMRPAAAPPVPQPRAAAARHW